jgi:H+-transporting ATPase
VLKIGEYLIILAVALVVLIIGVALFRGGPILTTLQFALVLLVAAIPVAMPTVLSVTMAVGARMLVKKEAIVSRLIDRWAAGAILCLLRILRTEVDPNLWPSFRSSPWILS